MEGGDREGEGDGDGREDRDGGSEIKIAREMEKDGECETIR